MNINPGSARSDEARNRYDAIVIGAGPAGSSAAILLSCAGWSVALVEKQSFPRRKVCGECIAASNLPLLDALGIGLEFDNAAGPELRKVALMRGDRQVAADLPTASNGKYAWGKALGRETLDTLLLDRARLVGAHILQPWSVQTLTGSVGNWHCEVRAQDSDAVLDLRAPIVIDAHGSWETLPFERRRDNQHAMHRDSDLLAFKANFRHASLEEGLLPILSFDGGYGGMVVADDAVTTLACCIRRDRLKAYRAAAPGLSAGDVVEALLKRTCKGVRIALHTASREGPWLATGALDPGIRLGTNDGLFRVGNAAGEAHPVIGEGMSMAIQSAWLLCTHLLTPAQRDVDEIAWQRGIAHCYEAEWRREFAPRLRLAACFAHLLMRPATAAPTMALARAWPGILTLGAKLGGKARCAADVRKMNRLISQWPAGAIQTG